MFGFKKIEKGPDNGKAYNRKGKFYIYVGWGGNIHSLQVEIGRLFFGIEAKNKD